MKTHLTALVAFAIASAVGGAHAVGVPGQGDWVTTLLPRDLDGNAANGPEAFYDTALNISWLRNANVNGLMNWTAANTWANTLVVNGVAGWRLPTMVDTGAPGCDFSFAGAYDCGFNVQTATSEMAHLWYVTLGNKSYYWPVSGVSGQPGWGTTNTGNFQSLVQSSAYWSGLQYAPNPANAWLFGTYQGNQNDAVKSDVWNALAVRPGDVAAVPEPRAAILMLAGLGVLGFLARRRKDANV